MPSSIGSRQPIDAASALLIAARANIDATLVALEQARGFLLPAPPGSTAGVLSADPEPLPEPTAVVKPRAARKVKADPKPAPSVPPVSSGALLEPPSGALSNLLPAAVPVSPVHAAEIAALDALKALGAGAYVARVIAARATGLLNVAAHKPIYAALSALADRGVVVKAGRTYALLEPKA